MQNKEAILKQKTAKLSIFSNSSLILLKLVAGILSGSVSIISEAIHSGLDLVASIIAFIAVKISDKPADEQHPYGHGKFENVSGVIESLLIFAAAIWIIYEAVNRYLHTGGIIEESGLKLGIAVMFVSGIVNLFISRRLFKVAKQTNSVALEADALHLKTDIYTSIGVSMGLLLLYITSWQILDSLIALLVALLIIYEAYQMLIKSFNPLLDTNLPKHDLEKIRTVIHDNISKDYKCKLLKTRQSGQKNIIEFTLMVPLGTTIEDAAAESEKLKEAIGKTNPRTEVIAVLQPWK